MNYLLRASSNDEHWNGDCDYFVVSIDKQIAKSIMERRKAFLALKKKDDALWEFFFWGAYLECVSYAGIEIDTWDGPTDKEKQTLFDDNGFLKLPDDYKVPEEAGIRTECEQMGIREEGVFWTCYPKHAEGITITSETLPYSLIEEML
jgi:hypothetical protein